MKQRAGFTAALALCLALSGCGTVNPPDDPPPQPEQAVESFDNTAAPLCERIGITNWGPLYLPQLGSEENSLIKGAQEIAAMGGKVIKIAASDLAAQYPLDDWSDFTRRACVDALQTSVVRTVLGMDFATYFISLSEAVPVSYADGMSEDETASVEQEFYDATTYLLQTYRGSGKTFVLQNWETDNYVGYAVKDDNAELLFRRYAEYFNARQDGINRARNDFVMSRQKNVYVFGALEVNKLSPSYTRPKAVDYTVPYTYADLYTYSSYEYKDRGTVSSESDVAERLREALNAYKAKLPKKSAYPQPLYFGDRRLAITEFGYPDKADGYRGEWQQMVARGHLLALKICNLQYAVYWQLCCNEAVGSNAATVKKLPPDRLRAYDWKDGDLNGFYLLRPDGTRAPLYGYLTTVFETDRIG